MPPTYNNPVHRRRRIHLYERLRKEAERSTLPTFEPPQQLREKVPARDMELSEMQEKNLDQKDEIKGLKDEVRDLKRKLIQSISLLRDAAPIMLCG
ncbi:hypothetical protein BGX38DRAFT_768419 [Terfezia claveryi]|nr:hypothetical protein BGX38DRAFT_768419 [Terfezia claveryi]